MHRVRALIIFTATLSWAAQSDPWASSPPRGPQAPAGLGDYVAFPSVGVSLRQPGDFEKVETFVGFGQATTQSSVVLMTIAAPMSQLTAGFTQEQMKTRGWTLISREQTKVDTQQALLVHFEQPAAGNVFLKWMLAFGDEKSTTMITATFPKKLEPELSARLKAVVMSVRRESGGPVDPADSLPFTITASAKLKRTPGFSNALLYTAGGTIPAKSPDDPLFIVAPSIGSVPAGDKRQLAERRLRETAQTAQLTVRSSEAIAIDGLEGFESLADSEDANTGVPLSIYQVMLFDDGGYILMQGIISRKLAAEYLPEFRRMARSLTRKR